MYVGRGEGSWKDWWLGDVVKAACRYGKNITASWWRCVLNATLLTDFTSVRLKLASQLTSIPLPFKPWNMPPSFIVASQLIVKPSHFPQESVLFIRPWKTKSSGPSSLHDNTDQRKKSLHFSPLLKGQVGCFHLIATDILPFEWKTLSNKFTNQMVIGNLFPRGCWELEQAWSCLRSSDAAKAGDRDICLVGQKVSLLVVKVASLCLSRL